MIFVTGDTHAPIDINKLTTDQFPEQKSLSKSDYVIICGDFGCVWNGGREDAYWQKWFNDKNFTTLFVDGNHENHPLLDGYPVSEWHGGNVHFIMPSVIHLMRGQVYDIDGSKFFTLGGAFSVDRDRRVLNKSWWETEEPSMPELMAAIEMLQRHDNKVDYIITHAAPLSIRYRLGLPGQPTRTEQVLGVIDREVDFKHWYFGHLHVDGRIDEHHTALYQGIVQIDTSTY